MTRDDHRLLRAVSEAISDGLPVDWPGLKKRNPGLVAVLELMEAMDEVAGAYRSLPAQDTPANGSAGADPEAGSS